MTCSLDILLVESVNQTCNPQKVFTSRNAGGKDTKNPLISLS